MAATASPHCYNKVTFFDGNKRKLKRSVEGDKERRLKKLRVPGMVEDYVVNLDDQDQVVSTEECLKMKVGSCYLPKDNELKPLGEDAHFICCNEQTFGVADGVGGWAAKGVDSGEYARQLMVNAVMAIHEEAEGEVNPRRVLNQAYLHTKAEGSSTACILTLRDSLLHVVNVGDSGFMVFRNTKLVYQSPIQQHDFNRPYQLGNSQTSDKPDMAMDLFVRVEAGDVVVVGTDGLLDNMYPTEIEEILKRETEEKQGVCLCPNKIALLVAEYALYNSFDKFAFSPFAKAAMKAGFSRMGGKVDDITVVVGIVRSSEKDLF
ncbi:hypothetical protein REPUB_Repub14bG0050400 [Reevesia pubescens]